jgi:thermolysin
VWSCVWVSVLVGSFALGCALRVEEEEGPAPRERWSKVIDPGSGFLTTLLAPPRLGPAKERLVAHAIDDARDFLAEHERLFGAAAQVSSLVFLDLRLDPLGGASVRFASLVAGLRVDGGDVVVLLAPDGIVRAVTGRFPLPGELDGPPVLGVAAAIEIAARTTSLGELDGSPRLVVSLQGLTARPAWQIRLRRAAPYAEREVLVDAGTGAVLAHRERLREVAARGSGLGVDGTRHELDIAKSGDEYLLRDETRGRGIRTYDARGRESLPGHIFRSPDPARWDESGDFAGSAVDAHASAARVWDYLGAVHDRRGLDGQGGSVAMVVHFGDGYANAFWDGSRAVFGDGDDETGPFAAALDVVAHELFHGLNQHTADLVYEGESGALDESVADVFGSLVELRSGGGNWLLGERLADGGLRDLADPARLGQPSHLEEKLDLPVTPAGDMGGVHANSTIPSHAAYLLAEGGVHRLSGIRVHAIGRERMAAIWYRALTLYLGSRASFADFAAATQAAAVDLYGEDSGPAASTREAWRAVGL